MTSLLKSYEIPEVIKQLDPSIPVVSASQLNTRNRCAWSWHFRYVKGYVPIPTSDTSEVGLLTHRLLQVGYETKKENPNKPYSFFKQKVQEELLSYRDRFETYEQMSQLKRAGNIVLLYFDTMAPVHDQGHHVIGIEQHFVVQLSTPTGNPYFLQGYIDLLEAMSGAKYRVEDHKSTPDKKRFYTPDQVQFDSQLKSYCIALRHMGYNVQDVAIRNYNTYDYKAGIESREVKDLFARTTAHYSEKELETFEWEIGLLVDEMFYSNTPIRRTMSRDCASCWVKEACLMDMKGMDLTLLLKHKYTRKPTTETVVDLILGVDRSTKSE